MRAKLREKLRESLQAVLPIGGIVLLLQLALRLAPGASPMPGGTLALMLVGMVMLIVGLMLFSMGTDMAMMPMGEHVGSALLSSRKLSLLMVVLLVFGFIVTAAEPDLAVLAVQVPSISSFELIAGISAGVGIFLVLAALRVLFRWKLAHLLMILYPLTFILGIFSSDYLAVAFDGSAVTTGPITVPFLLAIGSGFAAISSSKDADEDNFGICAVCSIGPILAVLILGMFHDAGSTAYEAEAAAGVSSAGQLLAVFGSGLWHRLVEVSFVVFPILGIFLIFQVLRLRLSRTELTRIFVGLGYLLVGLTVFLAGVNSGFMPAASYLGRAMGALPFNWVLVPICLAIGAAVVVAEPAVHVLTKQVEEVTSGAISRRMMLFGMALGVGLAMSLAMLRMLLGFAVWWVLLPGYAVALALTFFVPKIFVGIGFDSGGVAAGAMSAAFVLPFTIGACGALGGNPVTDAFGVVGMISMMPPITVQVMGVVYKRKLKKAERLEAEAAALDAEEAESEIEMLLRR